MKNFIIPTAQGMKFINFLDISFLKAINNYSEIYLKNNCNKILVCKTLGTIEQKLPDEIFFRCHRSYIVNIYELYEYKTFTGGGLIILNNGYKVKLAKRRKKSFFKLINIKHKATI